MKKNKFLSSSDLHLQSDNKRTNWLIQSIVILLLLSITTATIMVFHFTKNFETENSTQSQLPSAEKLVSPEVITQQQLNLQNGVPEGFKNELQGPRPSRFTRATESPVLITQRSYPRNIQEIIGHLQDEEKIRSDHRRRPDPFHLHKPENPGDVNLLAINNVRFALPVWANFKNPGAKRKVEENNSKGSQLIRSEIFLKSSEGDGVPKTFVRLNVYSKRQKKGNSKIIFPYRK